MAVYDINNIVTNHVLTQLVHCGNPDLLFATNSISPSNSIIFLMDSVKLNCLYLRLHLNVIPAYVSGWGG